MLEGGNKNTNTLLVLSHSDSKRRHSKGRYREKGFFNYTPITVTVFNIAKEKKTTINQTDFGDVYSSVLQSRGTGMKGERGVEATNSRDEVRENVSTRIDLGKESNSVFLRLYRLGWIER